MSGAVLARLAFLAMVLHLTACGFALRGSESLPVSLKRAFVETVRNDEGLARELERQLSVAGADLTANRSAASAVLKIIESDAGQRVLSVATTGGPEEYEVFHRVRFELTVDGARVYGPDSLTLTRDYTFDKNDILGKRREYDTLRDALQKDVASLILRRLRLSPKVT